MRSILEQTFDTESDRIIFAYDDFYPQYENLIGHYFRTLYNLVKFADKGDVENKRLYTNLIRAQLSSNELLLLFYNSLSKYGSDKLKPLVEKYSLLKTISFGELFDEGHRGLFGSTAY